MWFITTGNHRLHMIVEDIKSHIGKKINFNIIQWYYIMFFIKWS